MVWCVGYSWWLQSGLVRFIWAVVSESDGVSLTLAHWCGKPAHGGGTSSRGPPTKHVVCIRRTAPGPARALFGLEAAVALVERDIVVNIENRKYRYANDCLGVFHEG
jgi:hypothetical protein